jgi:hypothetical protein
MVKGLIPNDAYYVDSALTNEYGPPIHVLFDSFKEKYTQIGKT